MIQAAPKIRQNKDSAIEVMRDLFTNKDFLFMSLLPEDTEILLRKTPPSYRKQAEEKSKNNFNSIRNCSSTTLGSRLLSWVFVGECVLSAELTV